MSGYTSSRQVVQAYIDGSRDLDAERLRGCFHPQAVMNGYLNGRLVLADPEPFLADVAAIKAGGVGHRAFRGELLDLTEAQGVAGAVVAMEGFGDSLSFRDFLHLIRQDGAWSIMSKTFTSL